ncbi:class I SAM-dependent methyltransferase [Halococcoides cellulosivorans]|uniref:SAM-dependent methyltransferase n=1 Tax=Halococcoides cellulosivorans TaxID=1679096 RepID=A0A2R4WY98_9EURY|nr:class I SAM-dependent methyltransferase family protein [Halococcoides cellulosivorans]AWB26512.1 SAM-dependent methyltransferase [Halococcoides cellulosivorans]
MGVPCVRVDRTDGERTRQVLAEHDCLDHDHEISVEDGQIAIPVTDTEAVPADALPAFELTTADLDGRETQTMPADLIEDASYGRLGELVVIDEDDPERARELADAIDRSDLPAESVLNRASKIQGSDRVREWDVLVGETTATVHREHGHSFALDVDEVFFTPRLATERHRVVEQVEAGECVIDMFAGVGPYAVPMAARGAEVIAVDLNERAIDFLEGNAERNGVSDRITAIAGDVRDVAPEYADRADRLVMNLPHSADEFLDAAMTMAGDECVLHYYDIQHEDDAFGPGERAIREAAEAAGYDVSVEDRREVRSYAPHELNVCLDVRLRA